MVDLLIWILIVSVVLWLLFGHGDLPKRDVLSAEEVRDLFRRGDEDE